MYNRYPASAPKRKYPWGANFLTHETQWVSSATIENPNAANKIYNMAVGDRTTLNDLFGLLRDNLPLPAVIANEARQVIAPTPVYRGFREGDVRHSLADIGKAQRLLGYAPTHRLAEGIAEAMPWYIGQQ